MKKEVLALQDADIEMENGNRIYQTDLILREAECVCMVSTVYQKEVLTELLRGRGRLLTGKLKIQGKEIPRISRDILERQKVFVVERNTPYMNTLNIGENLFLLRRNNMKKIHLNRHAILQQTHYYFEKYHMEIPETAKAEDLTMADKILIGMLREISQGAALLVLYNISDMFSQGQMGKLLSFLMQLKSEGISILISDNNPERFWSVADQLLVWKDRRIVKKIYDPQEFFLADRIIMDGDRLPEKGRLREAGSTYVEIKVCMGEKRYHMRAGKGELVLVLAEAGEREQLWHKLLEASGSHTEYWIDGEKISYGTMADLVRQKIAFLDLEIQKNGILENLTEKDNILLSSYRKISNPFGFFKKNADYILKDDFLFLPGEQPEALDRKKDGWKILFYRWKLFHPRVLILYNVITAADIRDKNWMKHFLLEFAERGTTVILLENEEKFCLDFADRIEMLEYEKI